MSTTASPSKPAPALTPPPPTTTSTTTSLPASLPPATISPPPPPPLPQPSTFDLLPHLATLLARLSPTSTDPPLEPQNLPSEAQSLKLRLQKAQAAVEALPDMHRTTAEQEVEIREMEERVRRMGDVLGGVRERAGAAVRGMDGI